MRDNIVVPAWEVASESVTIKKFNFVPSLLATLYLSLIVLYQVAWSYVHIFNLKDQFFSLVIEFAHSSYFEETAITVGILFLFYVIITPIAEGGLVHLIARKDSKEPWDRPFYRWISAGLVNFLPIFEAHNLLAPFKLLSIITFYLFLLRVFGKDYALAISIMMATYLVFSIFVNVLFSYTRFFIIFEGRKAFDAMGKSVGMALENMDVTMRLYFSLFLVYVRTILTVLAFIVFPFVISAILTYVSIAAVKFLAIALVGIILVVFLVFITHLNSVLEIFVEALWYRAWKGNKERSLAYSAGNGHESHGHH